MNDLEKLASEIAKMNSIGDKISEITQRPATIGHTGEYIAAEIFDIELEESANAKGGFLHIPSKRFNSEPQKYRIPL
jgi:hypothetical protein